MHCGVVLVVKISNDLFSKHQNVLYFYNKKLIGNQYDLRNRGF